MTKVQKVLQPSEFYSNFEPNKMSTALSPIPLKLYECSLFDRWPFISAEFKLLRNIE